MAGSLDVLAAVICMLNDWADALDRRVVPLDRIQDEKAKMFRRLRDDTIKAVDVMRELEGYRRNG